MKEPSLTSGLKLLHVLSLRNRVRKGIAAPRPQLVQSMLARSVGRKVVTDNFDLLPAESRPFVWVTDYWATSGFYMYTADVSEIWVLGSDQSCT